jgi:DNA-binding transcriptional MerR regulator
MIYPRIVFTTMTLCGLLAVPVLAQDPQPSDTAPLEKRIAELERKLASLQKELQRLRQELHEKSPITVLPVKVIDAGQAAELLEKVYKDTPGVLVEALPKMKCVAVRADKTVTKEIRDFLRRLDEASKCRVGGFHQPPIRLDDTTLMVELIRWLEKKGPTGTTQSKLR